MTKFHKIKGKIMWANNLFTPDSYEDGPAYYKAHLVVDLATRDKFKDSGVRTKIRGHGDVPYLEAGDFEVLLKRPEEHKVNAKGEKFGGGQPKVLDADGNEWPDVVIGNGSLVEAEYCTYKAGKFSGHRLESVKILEHVPYERDEDGNEKAGEDPKVEEEEAPW